VICAIIADLVVNSYLKIAENVCQFNTANVSINDLTNCTQNWDPLIGNNTGGSSDSTFSEIFITPFKGYYSNYDLNVGGEYIDIFRNYTIENFISDRNLKCKYIHINLVISVIFNLYLPYTDSYLNLILGIEMLQYFESLKFQFMTSPVIFISPDNLVVLIIYVMFCASVFLSLIKLIYEMNLKINLAVQLMTILGDLINLGIIIFLTL
jgi:hypothetical protein